MKKGPSMFDLPSLDPSVSAAEQLDKALKGSDSTTPSGDIAIVDEKLKEREQAKEEAKQEVIDAPKEKEPEQVDVRLVRKGEQILAHESDRNGIRLLIITRDESVMTDGSITERRIRSLALEFSEVHVVVIGLEQEEAAPALRLSENLWAYRTNSRYWWKAGLDAYRIVNEQLAFAGGFRADIVLAEDPYESGMAGYFIAKKYKRPLQIHVLEDYNDPAFLELDPNNQYRLYMALFSVKRAQSVRTKSEFLRREIVERYPNLKESTEVLPLYHNLEAWRDHTPALNLHERYPQFKFIMLIVSLMQPRSRTAEAISGAAPLLMRYPTIGLVIVGSGPLRAALEKQVLTFGIQKQVEFEPTPSEYISHLKSANILIHISENADEDDVVMAAAAVRLPMIAGTNGLASTLFVEGESAYLCDPADPTCVSEKINRYLNDNQQRTQFSLNAQEIIFERIEQDYGAYLDAYRESIERAVASES